MKAWPPAAILMRLLVKVPVGLTFAIIAGIHDLRPLAQIFQLQTQIPNEECLSEALGYAVWALDAFQTLTKGINGMVCSDCVDKPNYGL